MTSPSTRNASLRSEAHINRKNQKEGESIVIEVPTYFIFLLFLLVFTFFLLRLWMYFSSLLWTSSDHFSMNEAISTADLFWTHTVPLGPPENYSFRIHFFFLRDWHWSIREIQRRLDFSHILSLSLSLFPLELDNSIWFKHSLYHSFRLTLKHYGTPKLEDHLHKSLKQVICYIIETL